jgi:hypothetical protein
MPSNFDEVERNIVEIQKISNVSRVVGAFTAQAGNMLQAADCVDYFINKMNIVFYSHRVSYPNVLSAQVLPMDLKTLAISRLNVIKEKVPTFENVKKHPILEKITVQQIQDNINYLNAKDESHRWSEFVQFNRDLDKSRNQGPLELIVPEFKEYI